MAGSDHASTKHFAGITNRPNGAASLTLKTDARTDFLRKTFYGFIRDSGHACLRRVSGDFTASTTIIGRYETLCLDLKNTGQDRPPLAARCNAG